MLIIVRQYRTSSGTLSFRTEKGYLLTEVTGVPSLDAQDMKRLIRDLESLSLVLSEDKTEGPDTEQ